MSTDKFDKTVDAIQSTLVWFVILVITVCIAVLFLFDVLAGTGTMLFLTNGKDWQSVVISLATTGLLFALMFIGYMLFENPSKTLKSVGGFVLSFAFLIYVSDVVFDALLSDVLRYGTILGQVDGLQWMFRFLLGGVSTVGDALAIAMILGMPVLKSIIKSATKGESHSTNTSRPNSQPILRPAASINKPTASPAPRPNFNPAPKPSRHRPEPTYHPVSYQPNAKPITDDDI